MLDGSSFTERNFKEFIKAGYEDKHLHPIQMQELRRAFYGGLASASFNVTERERIIDDLQRFFENEVKEHMINTEL